MSVDEAGARRAAQPVNSRVPGMHPCNPGASTGFHPGPEECEEDWGQHTVERAPFRAEGVSKPRDGQDCASRR